MPGCCAKPCGRICGRSLLSNTQSTQLGGHASAPLTVLVTPGTHLNPAGEVFTLTCDAVVTFVFVGTLTGYERSFTVSTGIQVENAALPGAYFPTEAFPPRTAVSPGSITPVTAVLTAILTPGTYVAYVNLIGTDLGEFSSGHIFIDGVISVTSVKRFA